MQHAVEDMDFLKVCNWKYTYVYTYILGPTVAYRRVTPSLLVPYLVVNNVNVLD